MQDFVRTERANFRRDVRPKVMLDYFQVALMETLEEEEIGRERANRSMRFAWAMKCFDNEDVIGGLPDQSRDGGRHTLGTLQERRFVQDDSILAPTPPAAVQNVHVRRNVPNRVRPALERKHGNFAALRLHRRFQLVQVAGSDGGKHPVLRTRVEYQYRAVGMDRSKGKSKCTLALPSPPPNEDVTHYAGSAGSAFTSIGFRACIDMKIEPCQSVSAVMSAISSAQRPNAPYLSQMRAPLSAIIEA